MELLRSLSLRPELLIVLVVLFGLAGALALRVRGRRHDRDPRSAAKEAVAQLKEPEERTDPRPGLRRARLQIIMATVAIVGLTLIALFNTF